MSFVLLMQATITGVPIRPIMIAVSAIASYEDYTVYTVDSRTIYVTHDFADLRKRIESPQLGSITVA